MQALDPKCISDGCSILYYNLECPQSRSCFMLTKILGIQVKLKKVKEGHNMYELLQINPFGTLPTLKNEEVLLNDSHSILLYLCDKYAPVHLQYLSPKKQLQRLQVLSMLFYEGGVLYPTYYNILAAIQMGNMSTVDLNKHQSQVLEAYNYLDSILGTQLCMAGNDLTVADLSIMTTMSGLNVMFPISKNKRPNLHKWFEMVLKKKDWYIYNAGEVLKLSRQLKEIGQSPLKCQNAKLPLKPIHSTSQAFVKNESCQAISPLRWNDKINLKQKFFRIFSKDRISTSETLQASDRPAQGELAHCEAKSEVKFLTSCGNCDKMIQRVGQIKARIETLPRSKKLTLNNNQVSYDVSNGKKYPSQLPRLKGKTSTFEVISSKTDLELKSSPGRSQKAVRKDIDALTKVAKHNKKTGDKHVVQRPNTKNHQEIRAEGNVDLKAFKSYTILTDSKLDAIYGLC